MYRFIGSVSAVCNSKNDPYLLAQLGRGSLHHLLMVTASEVGGSESARTEHPNREAVSSRPCVRALSVIDDCFGAFPFPFCP